MYFIKHQHQVSKQIEEELVTLNSKTPFLSEATEVLNEISVNISPKLLISKITTSFEIFLSRLI